MTLTTAMKTWLRRTILPGTAAYWLGLFILTHTPVALPIIIVSSDKSAHFIGYAMLATALFASLRVLGRRDPMLMVLVIGLAYGAIDEWLQIPVGRSCELNDWFADAAGVAAAVTVCTLITRWCDQRAARSSW
jgi:VanZ family protein